MKIKVGIVVDSPSDRLCLDGGLPANPPAVVRVLMQQSSTITIIATIVINATIIIAIAITISILNAIDNGHLANDQLDPCSHHHVQRERPASILPENKCLQTLSSYFLFHYFYEVNRHCLPISVL